VFIENLTNERLVEAIDAEITNNTNDEKTFGDFHWQNKSEVSSHRYEFDRKKRSVALLKRWKDGDISLIKKDLINILRNFSDR